MTSLLIGAAVMVNLSWLTAQTAPFRPEHDTDILERLPHRPLASVPERQRDPNPLDSRQPASLDVAVHLAGLEVERSHATSDPRPLGRAEALLAPWWDKSNPPIRVLLLPATIRQRGHSFAPARADLRQAVQREPDNAQAWLMLASIEQVTGDLDAAAMSCERLHDIASPLAAQSCVSALDGVRGRAAQAYDDLAKAMARPARPGEAALRNWCLTLLAELAARLDRNADADRLYRLSLAADPGDTYAMAAYADFLLDAGRAQDVLRLIAADSPIDTLLLRRAQAAHRLGNDETTSLVATLDARFAASRQRGDRVHQREEARFRLELTDDAQAALELAKANWQVQKEPLDARILLECAIAADRPDEAAEVVRWIRSSGLQGSAIASLANRIERG